jgi:hypothetical protein
VDLVFGLCTKQSFRSDIKGNGRAINKIGGGEEDIYLLRITGVFVIHLFDAVVFLDEFRIACNCKKKPSLAVL